MGSKLLFYLVIKPISKMPYFLLYRLSDFFFVILYYVIGYRKNVVMENLKNSFPDKTASERKKIARQFYRHFTDLIFESLKNFSITEDEAMKRMKSTNHEIMDKFFDQGKSVVLCGGHYCNWELWAMVAAGTIKLPVYGIYKELSNKFFDRKMKETRGRYGLQLIATKNVTKTLEEKKDDAIATAYGFDQSPGNPRKAYWLKFLNQDTPCSFGAEKFAVKYNSPVVYVHIQKPKRGFYEVSYEEIFTKPQETGYGEIITKINQILEKDIRKVPHLWLWSHRRWKHKRQSDDQLD